MKKLFSTLSNTYKTFKLLSNPKVNELLSAELQKQIASNQIEKFDGKTFHHGHFFIQVVG